MEINVHFSIALKGRDRERERERNHNPRGEGERQKGNQLIRRFQTSPARPASRSRIQLEMYKIKKTLENDRENLKMFSLIISV